MTAALSRCVLVTRPQPAADEFAERLRRDGFATYLAPLTEYVDLEADLSGVLKSDAVIFTSAQGVNVFTRRSPHRDIPVFAVGEATALAASRNGFQKIFTATGGSVELAELIRSRKNDLNLRHLFHASGEDTAEELGQLLKPDGIDVARVAIYKANFIDSLPKDTADALAQGVITTVTFFSLRTVQQFVQLMADKKLSTSGLEAVCLSTRVATAVNEKDWRRLSVARTPHIEAVMEILKSPRGVPEAQTAPEAENGLDAGKVIEAFGGIRPLANKMRITASTVQGWKKRGIVPESRVPAVMAAAYDAGIDVRNYWREGNSPMAAAPDDKSNPDPTSAKAQGLSDKPSAPAMSGHSSAGNAEPRSASAPPSERRTGGDRRKTRPVFDNKGFIHTPTYVGPDRRSGLDRRAYHQRQQEKIRKEKWRFINRTIMTATFFTCAITYAAVILLAPELLTSKGGNWLRNVESLFGGMMPSSAPSQPGSVEGAVSHRIEQIQNATADVPTALQNAQQLGAQIEHPDVSEGTMSSVQSLLQVVTNFNHINNTSDGKPMLQSAMGQIRDILGGSDGADPAAMNNAVAAARENNPALKQALGGVSTKDLGAAALLLALNEFRSNVNGQRPFENDLALLQKFAGSSPGLQQSLAKLAPYAKTGVLSPQALQNELKAAAGEIVMAKLQGQDASVKARVMQHMAKLVKVRRVDDVTGDTPDAVVARAQLMLNQGDVNGAIAQLQTLQGASADAAAPIIQQAQGTAEAEDGGAEVTQQLLQQLSAGGFSLEGLMGGLGGGGGGGIGASPYVSPAMQGGGQ